MLLQAFGFQSLLNQKFSGWSNTESCYPRYIAFCSQLLLSPRDEHEPQPGKTGTGTGWNRNRVKQNVRPEDRPACMIAGAGYSVPDPGRTGTKKLGVLSFVIPFTSERNNQPACISNKKIVNEVL